MAKWGAGALVAGVALVTVGTAVLLVAFSRGVSVTPVAAAPGPVTIEAVASPLLTPVSGIPGKLPVGVPGAEAARPDDVTLLSYQSMRLGSPKMEDVTPGKVYQVAVFQDPGSETVNRILVDLDRDGQWDERILFGAETRREASPSDDGTYSSVWVWREDHWARN